MTGPEVAAEIQRRGLPVRVLALSSYDSEHYVRGMLAAGARGYLLKDEQPDAIVAAVRRAMAGETTYSAHIAAKLANWARDEYPAGLTEREMDVLRGVAGGLSNKELAQRLKITTRTAEFHVNNILHKLGAASRVEAAVWAVAQGVALPPRNA